METDLAVIKAIQSGQTEEFGALYDKYIEKIYNFIYLRRTTKKPPKTS